MIFVASSSDHIDLIFFKLLFYFDEFQPGRTRFWNVGRTRKKPLLPFDTEIPFDIAKKVVIKSNVHDDAPAICMAHIFDPEDREHAIVVSFPLMIDEPQLVIRQTGTGIKLGCDEAGHDLGNDDSKPEEREAFQFFIDQIKRVISECIGNADEKD